MGLKTNLYRHCPTCEQLKVKDGKDHYIMLPCKCPVPPGPVDPPHIAKPLARVVENGPTKQEANTRNLVTLLGTIKRGIYTLIVFHLAIIFILSAILEKL